MKAFKTADCVIQGLLMLAGLFFALQANSLHLDIGLFLGYFLVGGWQIISVIVHFFYESPYKKKMRRIYLITLGILILVLLLSLPIGGIVIIMFSLLFFSPVMAVYYLVTCIRETKELSLIMAQPTVPVQAGV